MDNYTTKKLSEDLVIISENCGSYSVSFFLIIGKERALLIDSGEGNIDLKKLVSEYTDLPFDVVHTHSDHDHIGGDRYAREVYMHPSEFELFNRNHPHLKDLPIKPVWDKQLINIGEYDLEVMLTPGHTPGSISLFDRKKGLLFSGDMLSDIEVYMTKNGRSLLAYKYSVDYKYMPIKDDIKMIFAAHGNCPLEADIIDEAYKLINAVLDKNIEPISGPDSEKLPEGSLGYRINRTKIIVAK